MGTNIQCFIDLGFQGRLLNGDESYLSDILFLREQIVENDEAVWHTPGHCMLLGVEHTAAGKDLLLILLKTKGVWTPLFIEVRLPGVLVLYDRRRV